jgi:hypothetical protein
MLLLNSIKDCMQIELFFRDDIKALQNEVNQWLTENASKMDVEKIIPTESEKGWTITIVYTPAGSGN